MSGGGLKFTTAGTGKDTSLAALLQTFDPVPSFAITIRADPGNSSGTAVYCGRKSAYEPFYADDSRTYYSCIPEELIFNDGGNSGLTVYFDFSGPTDPRCQSVTAYIPPGRNPALQNTPIYTG